MKQIFLSIMMLVLFASPMLAQQFDLSAQIRPRFESRHGYKTLIAEDTDGANFISQRTRLNFNYGSEKIKLGVSMQNVRTWGDVGTLAAQDNSDGFEGTTLHEAWAEAIVSDKFSMKLGRQEIVYDDHRIFGHVGWAQQARSHDAFIFKIKPADGHKVDVGFALNANGQGLVDSFYDLQHKNFQYAWYHGNFDKLGVSLLVLNTGVEYIADEGTEDEAQKVSYRQTVGPRLTYKTGNLNANAAFYMQAGEVATTKVNAMYYAVNLGYKVMDGLNLGLGYESLSGNSQNPDDFDPDNIENNAFTPLFGTNHKFNGWMDYFYVGNHINSVGLNDISATLAYKNGKYSAKLIPHFFSAAADVHNGTEVMDANLGTEVDFVFGYKVCKSIMFNAGYSHMLATDTMKHLKGVGEDTDTTNNWGWIMFTFKPKLFSSAPKAE